MSAETVRLIRDGEKGWKGDGGGGKRRLYTNATMSTETVRLIRDGEKGGGGVTEIGEEGDYIPNATMSAETVRLIRDGEKGWKGDGGGGKRRLYTNATMSTETLRLIRDGERGGGEVLRRLGKREIIYLTLQCPQKS